MNLAYKYPIIFWNCANLIIDAGGNEKDSIDEDEILNEMNYTDYIEDFCDNDDDDDDEEENNFNNSNEEKTSKKKIVKKTNFGKIAAAIGKMKMAGIKIVSPDIQKSLYTFSPDVENNEIRYGLSGMTRIGEDLIKNIIINRPYSSIQDFIQKISPTKPQMINLIKSGAFDCFGNRTKIMDEYINLISDTKKRLTLQNMKMLIDYNLLPESLNFEKRVYNFNKYLKKFKEGNYYLLDENSLSFLNENYDIDSLINSDNSSVGLKIEQKIWDKIYKKQMDSVRIYLKEHQQEKLLELNNILTMQVKKKYCDGNISKWEMDSISCYIHKHELEDIDLSNFGVVDFNSLFEEPEIEKEIIIKDKVIPIYHITRIAGTVLDRDKTKRTITLLTTTGVVTVKMYGDVFPMYDKQISEKDITTDKKKVAEKSWFTRGNKIIVTGIRRGEIFMAKKYAATPYHLCELLNINTDNTVTIQSERKSG